MTETVTAAKVVNKLTQLKKTHYKRGNTNVVIGIDTLCLLFNTNFDSMLRILQEEQQVRIDFRTPDCKKTGKNNVAYVTLLTDDN